jgi:ribosomal protein L40E/osmotically-inducible protein OsmY
MICQKCRANIPETAKFCPKCGAKVEMTKVQMDLARKCPNCGAENHVLAKFCSKCGKKMEAAEELVEAERPMDVIVCPKCGAKNPSTAKFCRKDGTPLKVPTFIKETLEAKLPEKEIKAEAVKEPKVPVEEKGLERVYDVERPKNVIICPKCGMANPITARFCKKDGTPLRELKHEAAVRPEIIIFPEYGLKEKAAKPSRMWLLIAVIGVVLIFGSVGSYLYFSGIIGKKSKEFTVAQQQDISEAIEASFRKQDQRQKLQIDINKLESDLNSALRERGLDKVYAEVNEDLIATLKGTVDDPRDNMMAINVAKSFKELKDIKSEILVTESATPAIKEIPSTGIASKTLTSPPPVQRVDPSKVEIDINRTLRNAGFSGITVEVSDNLEVTLKGSVSSMEEKFRLLKLVRGIKGIKEIKDMVFVIE